MDDLTVTGSPASGPACASLAAVRTRSAIELDQRIQLRIQPLDLPYMLLGKFHRRNLPLLKQRKLLYRRQ